MNASFFKRFIAWFIDRIIILILFLIASIIILGPYNFAGPLGLALAALGILKENAINYIRNAYNYYIFFLVLSN